MSLRGEARARLFFALCPTRHACVRHPVVLILPPLVIQPTPSIDDDGFPSWFVEDLLLCAVARAPCAVEGAISSPIAEAKEAVFWLRLRGRPESELLTSCGASCFRPVLARLAVRFFEGQQLYGGAAHRRLQVGSKAVRATLFTSNEQLSGYWLRLYCARPGASG